MKKKRSKAAERVYTVFFMFITTLVFISVLTFVHLATKDIVALNENLAFRRSLFRAGGLVLPADAKAADAAYKKQVSLISNKQGRYYRLVKSGTNGRPELQAYILRVVGSGLWGRIVALVGLTPDLKSVSGVEFTEQTETPGLGARIDEPWFKRQLVGKKGPTFTMDREGTRSGKPDSFDAVSGATVSSTAVKDILEKALRIAPRLITTKTNGR